MDADKLDKLRAVADEANDAAPGLRVDWSEDAVRNDCGFFLRIGRTATAETHPMAPFIATFNPSLVKALLDVVEALQREEVQVSLEYQAGGLKVLDALAALAEKVK